MKPETERWLGFAEEDMSLATMSYESGYSRSCLYHCQQAVERLLKAVLIEERGRYRKVHDLIGLAADASLELSDAQEILLGRLTELYIPTRYGDEVVVLASDAVDNYYRGSGEIFAWLRHRLK